MPATADIPVLSELAVTAEAAALCGLIYARSWPITATHTYGGAAVAARIAERPVSFWAGMLARSPVRVVGAVGGSYGFALVTDTEHGFELSYIFVEPEAIGTGLAAALYDEVLDRAPGPLHAWVLTGNERSLRFFAARGWAPDPKAGQPSWAGGHTYTRLRPTNQQPLG